MSFYVVQSFSRCGEGVRTRTSGYAAIGTTKAIGVEFNYAYCPPRPAPHIFVQGQVLACPRAARKSATYEVSVLFRWQRMPSAGTMIPQVKFVVGAEASSYGALAGCG